MDIEKVCRDDLVAIAKTYARHFKLSPVTVSKKFHGATHFLTEFRSGKRTITLKHLAVVVDAFRDAWPEELNWPATTVLTRQRG